MNTSLFLLTCHTEINKSVTHKTRLDRGNQLQPLLSVPREKTIWKTAKGPLSNKMVKENVLLGFDILCISFPLEAGDEANPQLNTALQRYM